jgi:hypothetical protein
LLAVLVLRTSHHKHMFLRRFKVLSLLFHPPEESAEHFGNNNKKPNAHFTHVALAWRSRRRILENVRKRREKSKQAAWSVGVKIESFARRKKGKNRGK